jgi:conjugal transfer pilus assembly protein TraV
MSVNRLRHAMSCGLAGVVLLPLAGCASFGGNVKGNFQCQAPGGICAPSSAIDDQALADIGRSDNTPAGGAPSGGSAPARFMRVKAARVSSSAPQGRGMRIVLPARFDRFGHWREAQTVYAEVASADTAASSPAAGRAPERLSLSDLASGAPGLASADTPRQIAQATPEEFTASVRQAYAEGLARGNSTGTAVAPASRRVIPGRSSKIAAPAKPAQIGASAPATPVVAPQSHVAVAATPVSESAALPVEPRTVKVPAFPGAPAGADR